MTTVPRKWYWPYDETKMTRDCSSSNHVLVSTPWVVVRIEIENYDMPKAEYLMQKLSEQNFGHEDLEIVSQFFARIANYPVSYILPNAANHENQDQHRICDDPLDASSPGSLLRNIGSKPNSVAVIEKLIARLAGLEWKWDAESALQLSKLDNQHDPLSLFTVARRFHLMESVENDSTKELFEFIRNVREDKERFRKAISLVVRQNHYITQFCESSLSPALNIAQSAEANVRKFIKSEAGHDVLLSRSLNALGVTPESSSALDCVVALMELFRLIAKRNFLAFSMLVDLFERSSYAGEDPLATLLKAGGYAESARFIDLHRQINDSGAHENVALSFLMGMAPVDSKYALEAMRLIELASTLFHFISSDLLKKARSE